MAHFVSGIHTTSNTAALEHLQVTANDNSEEIQDLSVHVQSLEKKMEVTQLNRKPAIRFAEYGHSIEDGEAGGVVIVKWVLTKLRSDCAAPLVSLTVRDAEGVSGHADMVDFAPIIVPVSGGTLSIAYPIRLPAMSAPGRAFIRAAVKYSCIEGDPDPILTPELPFRILDPAE